MRASVIKLGPAVQAKIPGKIFTNANHEQIKTFSFSIFQVMMNLPLSSEVISIEHQKLFALYHFSLPAFPPYGWLNIRKSNLPIASRTRERKWSFTSSAFSFFMFAVYILFMPTRLTTLLIQAIHIHSPQWNDSPMDFTSRRKQQCERERHSK